MNELRRRTKITIVDLQLEFQVTELNNWKYYYVEGNGDDT
jgi:hypothetical protein